FKVAIFNPIATFPLTEDKRVLLKRERLQGPFQSLSTVASLAFFSALSIFLKAPLKSQWYLMASIVSLSLVLPVSKLLMVPFMYSANSGSFKNIPRALLSEFNCSLASLKLSTTSLADWLVFSNFFAVSLRLENTVVSWASSYIKVPSLSRFAEN